MPNQVLSGLLLQRDRLRPMTRPQSLGHRLRRGDDPVTVEGDRPTALDQNPAAAIVSTGLRPSRSRT